MRSRGAVLLVSCYELGHQPLSLASPLAFFRGAGHRRVVAVVSGGNIDLARFAKLVGAC